MNLVYIRHPDLRLTTVGDEGVALHLGSRQYFTVNQTGVTLLEALEEPRSLAELVDVLTDEYDVTPDVAEATAREFLDRCCTAHLLRMEER